MRGGVASRLIPPVGGATVVERVLRGWYACVFVFVRRPPWYITLDLLCMSELQRCPSLPCTAASAEGLAACCVMLHACTPSKAACCAAGRLLRPPQPALSVSVTHWPSCILEYREISQLDSHRVESPQRPPEGVLLG